MVKPRRAALVFLVLAALLAVAWVSRARWLAALPAALGANAALITIIVAILGLLVAAGAAVVQWSGQRRSPPQPPGRLVQPVALDALRAQFRDLEKQTFAYVDRGALNRQLMFPSRLVITGDPKVGKTREAVELIGRILEPRHIPPARIFRPTTELRGTAANAVIGQIRKDVGDHGPLLLFVDDLPRFFQMNELDRLAAALNELKNCGDLHVVATARDDQLTADHRDWLSAHDFRAIPLSRWGADDVARLVDDGLYLVELPDDSEGRQALVDGNDGTPELTRLTLLALAGLGRSDRQTVEETQRDTYLDMWRATREELIARQPAVKPLLWAAAVFYAARVTPYTNLVLALAARKLHSPVQAWGLQATLTLLGKYGLERAESQLNLPEYIVEIEGIGETEAQVELTDFLLSYRRLFRLPGLRLVYRFRRVHAAALFALGLNDNLVKGANSQLRCFTAAIGFLPVSPFYLFRAMLHNSLGYQNKAQRDYDAAISLDPSLWLAYVLRGIYHHTNDRSEKALPDYNEAIRLEPDNGLAYMHRANLYHQLDCLAEEMADLDELIRLGQVASWAYYRRGLLNTANGRTAEGLADFSETIRLDPEDSDALAARGLIYARTGNLTEAIDDLDAAIRLNPNSYHAFYTRALAYIASKRSDQALLDLNTTLSFDPNSYPAHITRAQVNDALLRFDEAIADYSHAIYLHPLDASAFFQRGLLYTRLDNPTAARADFSEAIRLDPTNPQFFFNRGMLNANNGKLDEALADYTEAIQLDSHLSEAFVFRGILNISRSNVDNALSDFSEAIKLGTTNTLAFLYRGIIMMYLNKSEEAACDFESAAQLGVDSLDLHRHLASCYRDLGRAGDAARHVALARERLPEDDLYNRACLEAIAGNDNLALDLLAQALAAGQVDREWVQRDPDWKPLRDHPRFRELTGEP